MMETKKCKNCDNTIVKGWEHLPIPNPKKKNGERCYNPEPFGHSDNGGKNND